ncbi:MAG: glycosyl hydrolase [Bacteroidota bacterium]
MVLFLASDCWGQSDPLATCQTQTLYQQLRHLSNDHLLFGHQNSTFEGIGWEDRNGLDNRSDCLESVGDYPAIHGFDFVRGFIFEQHAKNAYERGGILVFSDHMTNFNNTGDAWNTTGNTVASLLQTNSAARSRFITHLNRVANFFNRLKADNGDFIPVIYRPFHENSGDWFWWGAPHCTPDQYVALWQFTVDYLRNERGLHHVLYAYSPSDPAFLGGYENRYPGDDYVDIIGFDSYAVLLYEMFLVANCQLVVEFAEAHQKVAALTEFGVNGGIQFAKNDDWFTTTFLETIKSDSIARKIAFAHTWRNDRPNHHWVPLPESPNHDSFKAFYEDEFTLFERDLPDMYDCSTLVTTNEVEATSPPQFLVYPSPAQTFLNLTWQSSVVTHQKRILIFNSIGQKVLEQSIITAQNNIDISNLPKGIYFVKGWMTGQMVEETVRFVKL